VQACRGNAYPEQLARRLGVGVCNCGCTMSTLREARYFFRDWYNAHTTLVTLNFGLVDSWETFRYAPYVLYYPDNPLRKLARKLVKKYKKSCRQWGLNARLGTAPVVAPAEYARRLAGLIAACRPSTRILLIEALPNCDTARNPALQRYNRLLHQAAAADARCRVVATFDRFAAQLDTLYLDPTHINAQGHALLAELLYQCHQEAPFPP